MTQTDIVIGHVVCIMCHENPMTLKNHLLSSFTAGGFFIALDQYLKLIARTHQTMAIYLWKPFIGWEYFTNPGIAFSLPFPNWLIVGITPIILFILLLFLFIRPIKSVSVIYGIVFILAGAISNFIDRILFGITIDYIRLFTSIINTADILIVTGTCCLFLAEWKRKQKKNPVLEVLSEDI